MVVACVVIPWVLIHYVVVHWVVIHCVVIHWVVIHCAVVRRVVIHCAVVHCVEVHCVVVYCVVVHCVVVTLSWVNVPNPPRLSCQKHAILCTLEHSTEILTLKRYLQTRCNITLAWLRK